MAKIEGSGERLDPFLPGSIRLALIVVICHQPRPQQRQRHPELRARLVLKNGKLVRLIINGRTGRNCGEETLFLD